MIKTRWIVVISSVILFIGCENIVVDPAHSNLNVEDFEATWERVNAVYPYLELKGINWDSLYLVYKPRAEQSRGDEIFNVLIDMLGELRDMHVHVKTAGGRPISTYYAPRWIKDKYAFDPIVVLINGVCYSTGDIFPEVMKQISSVTVIGDTTAGGSSGSTSSAPAEYELPSDKIIFVGTTDWRGYDGSPLEWIGCLPDILVEQTEEDVKNGSDKQLEFAINFLK